MNRETWLMKATDKMRPWFRQVDAPIPDEVRVSTGYSKRAGKGQIGWCWIDGAAKDKVNQIFISPELDDSVDVLATLLHELVHAADNCESGHTGNFRKVATELGLEGKMTATVPSESLRRQLVSLLEKIGNYPHAALSPEARGGIKKQSTRMIKVFCPNSGYIARTTAKWLGEYGAPLCPCCTSEMDVDGK